MFNALDSKKSVNKNDMKDFYHPPAWSQGHISLDDAIFLDYAVMEKKPEEIIEIGVASGCSSAVLLRALASLGETRFLHSYDIVDYCYFAPERRIGSAVNELAPQFRSHWRLHTGSSAINAGVELAGRNIKMAFIDADHRHPWATIDLLALLPALSSDCWIVLHDVSLANITEWKVYGPEILFKSWPGDKSAHSDLSNIAAIKLPGNYDQARLWLIESLQKSWEVDIDEYILNRIDIPLELKPEQRSFQRLSKDLHRRFIEFSEQGRDLVIWGAGKSGRLCLAELLRKGIRPVAFVDRDETKHSQRIEDIPILSIQQLDQFKSRPFFIVASVHASEILLELNTMGFHQIKDYVCYNPGLLPIYDKLEENEYSPQLLGMTTVEEQQYLFHYARDHFYGAGAIVDLGCWLGSTTIPLAQGLASANLESVVHAYDLFVWHEWMDRYAGDLKGRFASGDSFLSEFKKRLGTLASRVDIQEGDLTKIGWSGGSIEFLLVDAMKSWELCSAINRNFFPFIAEKKGLVMHQDFKFWGCPWIHLSMYRLRDCFEIERDLPNSPGTVFRLIRSPALSRLETPLKEDDFSIEEVQEAYDFWNRHIHGPYAYLLDCARLYILARIGAKKQALACLDSILDSGYFLDELFLSILKPLLPEITSLLAKESWQSIVARAIDSHRLICMWGAGSYARTVLKRHTDLAKELQYVIDSDPQKEGLFLINTPIVNPCELANFQSPPFVVVATSFASEVIAHLRKLGYVKNHDYCIADYLD